MKYLFILIFSVCISACSKKFNNSAPAKFSSEKLETLAKQYCAEGERLVELDISNLFLDFEDIHGNLYGFANGTGRCALTGDIDDAWGTGWFGVKPNSSCVPNGSFWTIKSRSLETPTQYYTFESVDPVGEPLLEMWGAWDLNTVYARDHSGLRILNCKMKE